MSNVLTDARELLATYLVDVPANLYKHANEITNAPAVVIDYDSPMAEPERIGSKLRLRVKYKLTLLVSGNYTNSAATEALEALVVQVLSALPAEARVVSVGQPGTLQVGTASLPALEIPLEISIQD